MKIVAASLVASLLLACGAEPGPKVTVYVEPSDLCIGIAGFEVLVSSGTNPQRVVRKRVPATILAAKDCLLPDQLSFPELDPDAPVTVIVNAYDGGGAQVRVTGRAPLPNLRGGSVRIALEAGPSMWPLLVFSRNPLLDGVPLEKVSSLGITKQMGGIPLFSADRMTAGDFFDAEPGAYGIFKFISEPPAENTALMVDFSAEGMIKSKRIIVKSMGSYYLAQ